MNQSHCKEMAPKPTATQTLINRKIKLQHSALQRRQRKDAMGAKNKGRHARHVIVIAGASGSGKTELIRKLSHPAHDAFITSVLKQLDCDPRQCLKRSTVERMQRLMHPDNFKKRKTQKLKHSLLLHIDLTSVNHNKNLERLKQIIKRTKRLDAITLYTAPEEWRQRILDRLHTEDEPSMQAALIALTARLSIGIANALYHREYRKWSIELQNLRPRRSVMVNTFEEIILSSIPPRPAAISQQPLEK